jgi:hypothetical protein
MFGRSLCCTALVLAATSLAAQTGAPARPQATPSGAAAGDRYIPAIMQEKTTTIAGCLQKTQGWVLTGATLAGQKEPATYRLEGIGDARLALFENKRVEATGVTQAVALAAPAKPAAAPAAAKTASGGAASTQKSLPVFEATAVKEGTGACS